MAKIIGSALPNIPWQEPPANTRTPFWRYDANPIIGRDGNARSNSVFNSAVVPFKDGFAGVFRCDSLSISMDIFAENACFLVLVAEFGKVSDRQSSHLFCKFRRDFSTTCESDNSGLQFFSKHSNCSFTFIEVYKHMILCAFLYL